jgi:tRNA pseudouridine32 synthase / 23S rRNA pseudouridine746 synthase
VRRRYTTHDRPLPEQVEPDLHMAALLQASVLFVDDHVLVINKPAGLAVHPGPRTPESLELYLPFLALDRKKSPHPVHRLDRDTSGCMVLGRTPGSVRQMSSWFSERQIRKSYLAIVDGVTDKAQGNIKVPLLKTSSAEGGWRMVVDMQGLAAETRWTRILSTATNSLLKLEPQTGRTHQLRVHCASIGHAITGDPVYGAANSSKRMYLHADSLSFPDRLGGLQTVEAPLPRDWPVDMLVPTVPVATSDSISEAV